MPARRSHDLADTVSLLIEAAGYVREQISADIAAATGLQAPWFETLLRLHRTPGEVTRLSEMAERIGYPQSSFSRLADRMEEAGLITRAPDPANRRATLIRATDAGGAALDHALRAYVDSSRRHVAAFLDDDDLDHLERITRKLRDANLPGYGHKHDPGDVAGRPEQ